MKRRRFGSAALEGGALEEALDRATDEAAEALDGATPDVGFLFVHPGYGAAAEQAAGRVRERVRVKHLMGCSAAGVCGPEREMESARSVSLMLGTLPDATITTFALHHDQLVTMEQADSLRGAVGMAQVHDPTFLLLADPFTVDGELMLERFNDAYPGAAAIGGLASGGRRPGAHVIYHNGEPRRYGMVGMAISGAAVQPVLSQGCRPIGRRFVITRSDAQKILGLSGRPALEAIQEAIQELPDSDREAARRNLLIGRVTNEAQTSFDRGDFVIRNFVAVLPEEGAVVVADRVRVGQTVQLQLRDRETAHKDMDDVLGELSQARDEPAGALLFACAGRGQGLFGEPHHDVHAMRRHLGDVPLAGFFCNGEIGEVGGRNFLHGFTASIALF